MAHWITKADYGMEKVESATRKALRVLWPVLIALAFAVSSNAISMRCSRTNRQKERKGRPSDNQEERRNRMKLKKVFSCPQHYSGNNPLQSRKGVYPLICLICGALLFSMLLWPEDCKAEEESKHPEQGSLAEIGAKLSNPVSDVWALFTEFDLTFSDGDLNTGNAKIGGRMIFQPILPLPLYGQGGHAWKLITRPTIPVLFSQPVPKGFDEFNNLGGLGDTQLPMLVSPPSGNWPDRYPRRIWTTAVGGRPGLDLRLSHQGLGCRHPPAVHLGNRRLEWQRQA